MQYPIPICRCGKTFRIGDLDTYQDLSPHAERHGWFRDEEGEWRCGPKCPRPRRHYLASPPKNVPNALSDLKK